MSFKTPTKNIAIIIAIVSFALGVLIYNFSPIIFQEGNPWPQAKGIIQLSFGNTDIVKISGSDNKYMTQSKNGHEVIKDFMKDQGYEFTEQMGSGYFYKSLTGENAVVTHNYYSRYYSLWNIHAKSQK